MIFVVEFGALCVGGCRLGVGNQFRQRPLHVSVLLFCVCGGCVIVCGFDLRYVYCTKCKLSILLCKAICIMVLIILCVTGIGVMFWEVALVVSCLGILERYRAKLCPDTLGLISVVEQARVLFFRGVGLLPHYG